MSTVTAYRRVPHGREAGDEKLAYLIFDLKTKRAHRYSSEHKLINISEPWYDDFYKWLKDYSQFWTLDIAKAYYNCDPDLQMDKGL